MLETLFTWNYKTFELCPSTFSVSISCISMDLFRSRHGFHLPTPWLPLCGVFCQGQEAMAVMEWPPVVARVDCSKVFLTIWGVRIIPLQWMIRTGVFWSFNLNFGAKFLWILLMCFDLMDWQMILCNFVFRHHDAVFHWRHFNLKFLLHESWIICFTSVFLGVQTMLPIDCSWLFAAHCGIDRAPRFIEV